MSVIRGINHITLAVADVERAVEFYTQALGLELRYRWDAGAYLEAGSDWICLSLDQAASVSKREDYTHIAFDVEEAEFGSVVDRLATHGARPWKDNRSEGASYYFLDPDGHKLEIHVGTLQSRLAHYGVASRIACGH